MTSTCCPKTKSESLPAQKAQFEQNANVSMLNSASMLMFTR